VIEPLSITVTNTSSSSVDVFIVDFKSRLI
jgi:hypothetical protein